MNIDEYRRRLQTLERDLSVRLARTVAQAREPLDESARDTGDESVYDEQKEEKFAEAEVESRILSQVREALARIADGSFGRCVVDGGPIEEKRLEAVPWTPYCLTHAQRRERAGA